MGYKNILCRTDRIDILSLAKSVASIGFISLLFLLVVSFSVSFFIDPNSLITHLEIKLTKTNNTLVLGQHHAEIYNFEYTHVDGRLTTIS